MPVDTFEPTDAQNHLIALEQRLKNRLDRLTKTAQYLIDQKAAIDTVPLLRARADEFLTRQSALPTPPPDADCGNTVTVGEAPAATIRRQEMQLALAEQLVPICAALFELCHDAQSALYAPEKAGALDIRRPASLAKGAAAVVIGLAELALDLLETLPANALTPFGITDAEIEAFRTAAADFGVQRVKAGSIRNRIATDEEMLDNTVFELEKWFKTDFKRAARLLDRKQPDFLLGLNRAFRLDDRRATRTAKKSDKPAL